MGEWGGADLYGRPVCLMGNENFSRFRDGSEGARAPRGDGPPASAALRWDARAGVRDHVTVVQHRVVPVP